MSLAKALGYDEFEKLLIINADDFGLCHSVNGAIQQLLTEHAVSSATIMMPCSFSRAAARWSASNPQYDVGVHLTFTSEWEPYKWGPVTANGDVSSLVTKEGYFPTGSKAFEEQAMKEHVKLELRNQIEQAISLGMTPTHADNHMGSLYGLQTGNHFLAETLEICAEYGLPFRLPRFLNMEKGQVAPKEMEEQAKQIAALADAKGVVILDYLIGLPFQLGAAETLDSFKADMLELLGSLKPGVSELIIHPSLVTDELRSFHMEPEKRGLEHALFLDSEFSTHIQKLGIRVIKWSELQKLQRDRKRA
ncbi:polysaccharide deacetylase family protein [Paenibacillus sp. HB172176]|uniref:polysaccharide deacetylase family protein n=1 Tax=Paenibacillus sp. HB172176 TaxID=2493690 RepID=UPI0014387039|nr:polysaccharide deacetylase family protein [Paenibacillus sp. HB172176]